MADRNDPADAMTLGRGASKPPPSSRPGLTLRIIGDGLFATHPLPETGDLVLGRAADADVRIEDPSISRRHAVLHLGPPLSIEDLGSANGTKVGDRQLAEGQRVEINPGDVVDLGSVMVVVQAGTPVTRPRRIWSHGYFEARLEDECARVEASGGSFAVARVHVENVPADVVLEDLAEALRPVDMVASYGPGEVELFLADAGADEAKRRLAAIVRQLETRGARPRAGLALYPTDGRTAHDLVARACDAVRVPGERGPSTLLIRDGTMQKLHRLVEKIAAGTISVLLLGETGVGKEVMAEAVHRLSPRAKHPFLRLNCAALSESLLESELFGHEKGAFTGAVQQKPGLLETADGGTVFLDEVGELPMTLQVKLLRVLEERAVLRVGGLKPRPIDVRFVAATNRDLEAEVAKGAFRQDLYYRLNGMSLVIPPLRERAGEIEGLAQSFVAQASRQAAREKPPKIAAEAMALLRRYSWPGNIRELRNVIERAVLLADDVITLEHLPVEKMQTLATRPSAPMAAVTETALKDELEKVERQRIIDALDKFAGNQTRAAKALGISRGTLLVRMEQYGLPRPRKK